MRAPVANTQCMGLESWKRERLSPMCYRMGAVLLPSPPGTFNLGQSQPTSGLIYTLFGDLQWQS